MDGIVSGSLRPCIATPTPNFLFFCILIFFAGLWVVRRRVSDPPGPAQIGLTGLRQSEQSGR